MLETSVGLGRVKSGAAGGFIWGVGKVDRRVHVCDFQMGSLLAEVGREERL